jgi:hypothetical protein
MITSETLIKFSPAYIKAQSELRNTIKDNNNPFFKSKYADLPDVIDSIKEILNKHGIGYIQTPTDSGDINTVSLTTRLLHESGEFLEDTCSCPLSKLDSQGFGSCITYLRRYSLQAICGIAGCDDDDGNIASGNQKPETKSTNEPDPFTDTPDAKPTIAPKRQYNKSSNTQPQVPTALPNKGFMGKCYKCNKPVLLNKNVNSGKMDSFNKDGFEHWKSCGKVPTGYEVEEVQESISYDESELPKSVADLFEDD